MYATAAAFSAEFSDHFYAAFSALSAARMDLEVDLCSCICNREYYCELTEEDFANIANISSNNYERFISCQP